jgi:hypothetical protein
MQTVFGVALSVFATIGTIAFAGGYIASSWLTRYDEALDAKRREPPGFRWWPKRWPAPTKEDFPEEVRTAWVFRDRCLKTFAICAGLMAITALVAAILGVDFPSH